MLAEGLCEVVCAVKLGLCTEVEVAALLVVQHSVYSGNARYADRCWWQSRVAIGVERGVVAQVFVEYAGKREVADGILYSWARLQRHTFAQTVYVHTRDFWHLSAVFSLFVDNRGKCHYLIL